MIMKQNLHWTDLIEELLVKELIQGSATTIPISTAKQLCEHVVFRVEGIGVGKITGTCDFSSLYLDGTYGAP